MISIVTGSDVDPRLVERVLASVPAGVAVDVRTATGVPGTCAYVEATTTDGVRHRVLAVDDATRLDVCAMLDACRAHHVLALPAATSSLRRLLARAA